MKKLLLLGLCCGVTAVAFAGAVQKPTPVQGASFSASADQGSMSEEAWRKANRHEPDFGALRNSDCASAEGLVASAGSVFAIPVGGYQFFTYTGVGTGLTIETCVAGTDCDSDIYILDNCANQTVLFYRDGDSACSWRTYLDCVDFTFANGTQYIIAFGEYSDAGGNVAFTVDTNCPPPAGPPANDNFANAAPITVDGACISGSTADATADALPPFNNANCWTGFYSATSTGSGPDVWYTFVADGVSTYNVSLCGSGYDTALGIFTAAGVSYTGSDDFCSLQSEVSCLLPAGPIYVAVDGYGAAEGAYTLCVTTETACVPWDCTGLPVEGEAYYTGDDITNGGCNYEPQIFSPLECGDEICGNFHTYVHDVSGAALRDMDWYEFTLLDNQPVTASAFSCAAGYSLWVVGTDCATQYGYVTGTDTLSLTTPCLPAGTYYFLIAPSTASNVPTETGYHFSFSCGGVCDMAPVITATCIDDQEVAGPWTITATITDDIGLTAANLWYNVDYGTYTSVPMTDLGGGNYSAEIPNQVAGSYVGYYFEALDGTNTSTYGTCYFDVFDMNLAPLSLVASDNSLTNVTVSWDYPGVATLAELIAAGLSKEEAEAQLAQQDASRAFLGYNVYRDGLLIGTVPSYYTLSYVDVPPLFDTVYTYHVTANYTAGESPASNSDEGIMLLTAPTHGGPDAFGYTWMNSDDTSGAVVYSYTDISATGTAVTLSDDNFVGPIALGLPFSFYGVAQTDVYIGSNGFLSFGAGSGTLGNTVLPYAADGVNNIIAGFWDDLAPHYAGSSVWYLSDVANGRFIVQYHVPNYGDVDPYDFLDFQVVLYSGGKILVNFQNLKDTDVSEATNGIENADGTIGLTANYNGGGGRLGDLLSVAFFPPCDPATGLVITMSAGDANLDWTAVGGASGYKVYGATSGYGPFTLLGTTLASDFVDVGAQLAGRKFYQVVSVCE